MRVNVNRRGFLRALFAAPLVAPAVKATRPALKWNRIPPYVGKAVSVADIQRRYSMPLSMHADCFAFVYPKIGDTITIRKPARSQV